VYLRPTQWNGRRQCVCRHPNAKGLNAYLRRFVAELEQKELEALALGRCLQPAQLRAKLRIPFYTFANQMIEKTSHRESTRRNRLSTLHALQHFRPQLEWEQLDYALLNDFEHHLRAAGCQPGTVAKHLKHLRLLVNLAIRHGHLPEGSSPFRTYPIPTARHVPVFLTKEELLRFERLAASGCPAEHRTALDAYLFCCYTGLRYSDFTCLTAEKFVSEGGLTWLRFATVKTGVEVNIPLEPLFEGKALALMERYQPHPEALFHLKSDRDVNRHLAALASLANITKHLTFHTARHTFATLLIYKGASITTVQKLLGHRRVTTTEHYGEILPEGIVKDLIRCQDLSR
jgi:site-specific recombinase XerD